MALPVIAIAGGTGHLGQALALRWSQAGYQILIGSRTAEKAASAVREAEARLQRKLESGTNAEVAARAEIVVIAVPYVAQADVLESIREAAAGKLVIDTTVPLVPGKVMRVQLPPEGCAALRTKALLAPGTKVVSAFHNVAAQKLATGDRLDCDVLVFGDEKEQRQLVIELCRAVGLRGLHGGALVNSAAAEALTSVLIFINRHYAVEGAGVKISGPPDWLR
ncbi:MAG: NADPH-dependent F420 reductase [Steroidobacteraceae bacterium]